MQLFWLAPVNTHTGFQGYFLQHSCLFSKYACTTRSPAPRTALRQPKPVYMQPSQARQQLTQAEKGRKSREQRSGSRRWKGQSSLQTHQSLPTLCACALTARQLGCESVYRHRPVVAIYVMCVPSLSIHTLCVQVCRYIPLRHFLCLQQALPPSSLL